MYTQLNHGGKMKREVRHVQSLYILCYIKLLLFILQYIYINEPV